MSRVSVVITAHDHGHLVGEAIDSALSQTHPCEVVVVDDGSTDDTSSVLEAFDDRIVSLVQANAGQGAALSKGIAKASGEVLVLLDADDLMEPTRVAEVLEVLDQQPTVMWVRHALKLADGEGRILDEPPMYAAGTDPRSDIVSRGRTAGTTSVLAIRRALWEIIGPIPPEYRGYADVYLLIAASLAAPHAHISEALTIRRLHQGQHFTLGSTDRRREALFHIQLRAQAAKSAASAAQAFGGAPEVAVNETWWQLKARMDLVKVEQALGTRDFARLLARFLRNVAQAPLPAGLRILAAIRASILALTPRFLFPTVWWWMNEGRRRRYRVV